MVIIFTTVSTWECSHPFSKFLYPLAKAFQNGRGPSAGSSFEQISMQRLTGVPSPISGGTGWVGSGLQPIHLFTVMPIKASANFSSYMFFADDKWTQYRDLLPPLSVSICLSQVPVPLGTSRNGGIYDGIFNINKMETLANKGIQDILWFLSEHQSNLQDPI